MVTIINVIDKPDTMTGFLAEHNKSAAFFSASEPPADLAIGIGVGIFVSKSP